jgi:hypothetical protein
MLGWVGLEGKRGRLSTTHVWYYQVMNRRIAYAAACTNMLFRPEESAKVMKASLSEAGHASGPMVECRPGTGATNVTTFNLLACLQSSTLSPDNHGPFHLT